MKKTTLNRRFIFYLVFFLFFTAHQAGAQGGRLSLSVRNVPLQEVFRELQQKSGFNFVYTTELLQNAPAVTVDIKDATIAAIMDECLRNTHLTYSINTESNSISIRRKPGAAPQSRTVSGTVTDEKGAPLAGATVSVRGTGTGRAVGADGRFSFDVPPSDQIVLSISYIGYKPQEVRVMNDRPLTIVMKEDATEISNVVVTGIMGTRDKATFTGSVTTIQGVDLQRAGTQNIFQSLRELDPSLFLVEDLAMGSDPNQLANIELRGQSGLTINNVKDVFGNDPNRPLFVLDGFVVSMQRINDLDMNRISSVTILKDAGSTAIYGANAANGVIVIETMKPQAGEVQIMYNANFDIDIPDLSSYNMMNSAEKLEFERLAGKFDIANYSMGYQTDLDMLYSDILRKVLSGVDTYWLSEPVRTGFSNKHSMIVTGGNENMFFSVGGAYRNQQGVMKNSSRDTWEGNMAITYRSNDRKFNITNRFTVGGFNFDNGNYGKFSTWVDTNPYFTKYNDVGGIDRWLEAIESVSGKPGLHNIANPMYNASLPYRDDGDNLNINNGTQVSWIDAFGAEGLALEANFNVYKTTTNEYYFKSSDHSDYKNTSDVFEKGVYRESVTTARGYTGSVVGRYSKIVDRHSFQLNARGALNEVLNRRTQFSVTGFPSGSDGNPIFASGYPTAAGSKPEYNESMGRSVSLSTQFNYNYDKRYLFDATYSTDGANTFGSRTKFKSFYSVGAGWNIHQEKFITEGAPWISYLRINGSYGATGNQNVVGITSVNLYGYYFGNTLFGPGVFLSSYGNPYLNWQINRNTSVTLDMAVVDNRFGLKLEAYNKVTKPSVVILDPAPSTGIKKYPVNVGQSTTKGLEFTVRATPIQNLAEGIVWNITLMGTTTNKGIWSGFGSALDKINQGQFAAKSLTRYEDGRSQTDLWAVRSLGIDPASGREIFLTKDGEKTFIYNSDDIVVVGNSRPDLEGTVSTFVRYGKISFTLGLRYSFGAERFNYAVFDKVENISFNSLRNNQDRRALYERWKSPGDRAMFKDIDLYESGQYTSQISSRFIQTNNELVMSYGNIEYDFTGDKWLERLKLKSFRARIATSELFRVSTIRAERGTTYPFSRSFTLTLSANF